MNLLDILSTSPHYFCRKWIGATNENSNFDLRVKTVKTDTERKASVAKKAENFMTKGSLKQKKIVSD